MADVTVVNQRGAANTTTLLKTRRTRSSQLNTRRLVDQKVEAVFWSPIQTTPAAQTEVKEAAAHPTAPSPVEHPWSWVHWSVCSLCTGAGPLSSRWCRVPGQRRVWEALPSDPGSMTTSLVPTTSPGPPTGRLPFQTLQWPRAGKRSREGRWSESEPQLIQLKKKHIHFKQKWR